MSLAPTRGLDIPFSLLAKSELVVLHWRIDDVDTDPTIAIFQTCTLLYQEKIWLRHTLHCSESKQLSMVGRYVSSWLELVEVPRHIITRMNYEYICHRRHMAGFHTLASIENQPCHYS